MPSMRNILRSIAVLVALHIGSTSAQQFPTVPSGTVIGRSQIGIGPSQAIPFAQLIALMLQSTPLTIPNINTNSIIFKGSLSGQATIQAQANAGTPSLTLPTVSGTIASSATTPIVIDQVTGNVSCQTCLISLPSRAFAQTLNLTGVAGVATIGYATAGDGGGATFKNVGAAALTDTGGSFTDAAGNNFQIIYPSGGLSWAAFGAFCDGSTDVRANLQNAISGTPEGGTLRGLKQAGACVVGKAAGAYALTANRPIRIVCDSGVAIQPTSALGTANDVLYLVGSPDGIQIQTIIEGCSIGNLSTATRFGRHGIMFDTTTAGNYFRAPIVKNVFIQAGTSGSGYGIFALNNTVNNPNGGVYQAAFGEGSIIQGGINLNGSGDSITIKGIVPHNGGSGADDNGINVNLVPGAGDLKIDVNFSQAAGMKIDCAYNTDITGEYELQSALTGTALINISAAGCTTAGIRFHGQIQANGGFGTPLLMNISSNVQSIVIRDSNIATPTSYTPIANASSSLQLGPNYWSVGAAAHVSGTAAANTFGGG